jgi:hypothetical protein
MTAPTPTDADVERVASAWRDERNRHVVVRTTEGRASCHVYRDDRLLVKGTHLFSGDRIQCDRFLDTLCARAAIAAMPAPDAVVRELSDDQWDSWYESLPSDLKRRLSIHDFQRLGNVFKDAMLRAAPPAPASEGE